MNADRRVVVTGLGAVTPLGQDMDTTWRRLLAGEGGGGPITAFAASDHSVRIACEASEFEPEGGVAVGHVDGGEWEVGWPFGPTAKRAGGGA